MASTELTSAQRELIVKGAREVQKNFPAHLPEQQARIVASMVTRVAAVGWREVFDFALVLLRPVGPQTMKLPTDADVTDEAACQPRKTTLHRPRPPKPSEDAGWGEGWGAPTPAAEEGPWEDPAITVRERVLGAAREAVMEDREADYGSPEDNFGLIAAYWSAHLDTHVAPSDVAAMMALLKLARLATGKRTRLDNWVDLAGYAACGAEAAVAEADVAE